MLRRNFLSIIPPSLMSLFIGNEHEPIDKIPEFETISKTHVYKIGDRVIYETTDIFVDISGRKDITELIAPNANTVYCINCTNLTKLELPKATYVNCIGCESIYVPVSNRHTVEFIEMLKLSKAFLYDLIGAMR